MALPLFFYHLPLVGGIQEIWDIWAAPYVLDVPGNYYEAKREKTTYVFLPVEFPRIAIVSSWYVFGIVAILEEGAEAPPG